MKRVCKCRPATERAEDTLKGSEVRGHSKVTEWGQRSKGSTTTCTLPQLRAQNYVMPVTGLRRWLDANI